MSYVIACGDEGVQINEGTRLGFVGAGFNLPGFDQVVPLLHELFGKEVAVASNEENPWIKKELDLVSWEQVNASAQQHIEALADQFNLKYAGYLPFADPKQLKHGVKGHMVRPHGIHIATKICFTLGGGEQTYNLGHYMVSADWVSQAKPALIKEVLQAQIDFYTKLNRGEALELVVEAGGELGESAAEANKKALVKVGILS